MKWLQMIGLLFVALFAIGAVNHQTAKTRVVVRTVRPAQTIYIRNLAPKFITDREITNAIPAWQRAVNVDFARYWGTAQYRLVFLGRRKAPDGASVATFVNRGPVQGALAYHDVEDAAPAITVYAGTGAYYGYDNSVSFTHELFELAADPYISAGNQGWPFDWVYLVAPDGSIDREPQAEGTFWAQEVCDPVEADSYLRKGADGKRTVAISDFVTPAFFNDGVAGTPLDFMYLVGQPFTIRPGGYMAYYNGISWEAITNFRKGVPSDGGFFKGEPRE